MLVLARRMGEQIKIGNDITVRVLRIRGGQVQIGIEAPGSIRVIRGELQERMAPEDSSPLLTHAPLASHSFVGELVQS